MHLDDFLFGEMMLFWNQPEMQICDKRVRWNKPAIYILVVVYCGMTLFFLMNVFRPPYYWRPNSLLLLIFFSNPFSLCESWFVLKTVTSKDNLFCLKFLLGTSIWGGEDVYACDTLDTMYVRPCARRQGHSLALLRTLSSALPPGDHLGLSHPVSLSMCKGNYI